MLPALQTSASLTRVLLTTFPKRHSAILLLDFYVPLRYCALKLFCPVAILFVLDVAILEGYVPRLRMFGIETASKITIFIKRSKVRNINYVLGAFRLKSYLPCLVSQLTPLLN